MRIAEIVGYVSSISLFYAILFSISSFFFNSARKRLGKMPFVKVKYVFIFTFALIALTTVGMRQPLNKQTFMFLGGMSIITVVIALVYYLASFVFKKKEN